MLPIKNYELLYELDEYGNIWSIRRKIFLKPFIDRDGYHKVSLRNNGKDRTATVHRLVAEQFGVSGVGPQINHIDGNKSNNHYVNLEFCTNRQNIDHAVLNKLHNFGETHGCHKLTESQVTEIRQQYTGYRGQQRALATHYNISTKTVWNIVHRNTWSHI